MFKTHWFFISIIVGPLLVSHNSDNYNCYRIIMVIILLIFYHEKQEKCLVYDAYDMSINGIERLRKLSKNNIRVVC